MRLRTKAMLFVIVTVAALFGLMIVGARAVVLGSFDRIEGRARNRVIHNSDIEKLLATIDAHPDCHQARAAPTSRTGMISRRTPRTATRSSATATSPPTGSARSTGTTC